MSLNRYDTLHTIVAYCVEWMNFALQTSSTSSISSKSTSYGTQNNNTRLLFDKNRNAASFVHGDDSENSIESRRFLLFLPSSERETNLKKCYQLLWMDTSLLLATDAV
mmetsp:Transcript_14649/g.40716  ORF Transcript_14649/g.40716 Transcript_14649/m.40716 type:complete len:108 (-) Transcript_14649:276-599(-)